MQCQPGGVERWDGSTGITAWGGSGGQGSCAYHQPDTHVHAISEDSGDRDSGVLPRGIVGSHEAPNS
jgi:hypothetical protein